MKGMTVRGAVVAAAGAAAGAHLLPSVLTIPAAHQRLAPHLSGRSTRPHIALTFDDGPDPVATPLFLDALAELDIRATFFVLGSLVQQHKEVAKRIAADGHELGIHCWVHTAHLLRAPWRIRADIARTQASLHQIAVPRFWRPPNGIITGAGLHAASSLGLTPVLWTDDGQDWSARATADTITARATSGLKPGAVVLLHDSDITSAPGSWRRTLDALPRIVEHCRRLDWTIGPLREHW